MAFGIIRKGGLFSASMLLSALFLLDIFYMLYELRESPKHRQKYFKGLFWLDLIAMLPLGWITGIPAAGIFRLAKLPRLIFLMRDWRTRHYNFLDLLRLVHAIYWMLLIIHWIGCGWYGLRETIVHGDFLQRAEWEGYLNAVYWAVATLGTVGYGDIVPDTFAQKAYAIFTMLTGIGFYGYLIGNVAGILSKTDPARQRYLSNLDRLSRISRFHRFPELLSQKIYDFYTYQWEKRQGVYDMTFVDELPEGIQREVQQYLRLEVVRQVPLFRETRSEFMEEIGMRLNAMILSPGEVLFRKGDDADRMYFILQGKVRVHLEEGEKHVAELSKGEFFGEIALFLDTTRTATIISQTFCDLYYLEARDFEFVIERFPEIGRQIKDAFMARVKLNAMREHVEE